MQLPAVLQDVVNEFEKYLQIRFNPQIKVFIVLGEAIFNMEYIAKLVAEISTIPFYKLVSNKRGGYAVTDARMIAMHFCFLLVDDNYTNVGRYFGNRDHSTVAHAIKTIKQRIETNDVAVTPLINEIENRLKVIVDSKN